MKTVEDLLKEKEERGFWVPACGRTEVPFRTRSGKMLLYCWHTGTGRHAYLDVDTDTILTDIEAEALLVPSSKATI